MHFDVAVRSLTCMLLLLFLRCYVNSVLLGFATGGLVIDWLLHPAYFIYPSICSDLDLFHFLQIWNDLI